MDLRRLGLEALQQILQASGHAPLVGWESIFDLPDSVYQPAPSDPASCLVLPVSSTSRGRPPPLGYLEKDYFGLIRIAFQSMTLMCDGLAALSPEHLRLRIGTLGQFGWQADTNVAPTAAESLF